MTIAGGLGAHPSEFARTRTRAARGGTHRGLLDSAPTPEVRRAIVEGRIRHLETELRAFEVELQRLYEEAHR